MAEPHKGPYRVIRGTKPDEMSRIVGESDEFLIAYVIRDSNPRPREQDDATADLLASAPEMLEACQMFNRLAIHHNWRNQFPELWNRIQSAIAKATGQ